MNKLLFITQNKQDETLLFFENGEVKSRAPNGKVSDETPLPFPIKRCKQQNVTNYFTIIMGIAYIALCIVIFKLKGV